MMHLINVMWQHERKPTTATSWATLTDSYQRMFYMHHPKHRIHTMAFVTPVVEHWLEQEIAEWVHDGSDNQPDQMFQLRSAPHSNMSN